MILVSCWGWEFAMIEMVCFEVAPCVSRNARVAYCFPSQNKLYQPKIRCSLNLVGARVCVEGRDGKVFQVLRRVNQKDYLLEQVFARRSLSPFVVNIHRISSYESLV